MGEGMGHELIHSWWLMLGLSPHCAMAYSSALTCSMISQAEKRGVGVGICDFFLSVAGKPYALRTLCTVLEELAVPLCLCYPCYVSGC